MLPEQSFELKALSESRFRAVGPPIELTFSPAAPGKPLEFAEAGGGGKPEVYQAVAEFRPTTALLREYAGAYQSEEIEAIYRIALEDQRLVLKRLKHRPAALRPRLAR